MTTKEIRRELAQLIEEKQKDCTTDKQRNKAVNEAREEINKKYGKNWRFKSYYNPATKLQHSEPSFYYGHRFGEHWME